MSFSASDQLCQLCLDPATHFTKGAIPYFLFFEPVHQYFQKLYLKYWAHWAPCHSLQVWHRDQHQIPSRRQLQSHWEQTSSPVVCFLFVCLWMSPCASGEADMLKKRENKGSRIFVLCAERSISVVTGHWSLFLEILSIHRVQNFFYLTLLRRRFGCRLHCEQTIHCL